MSAVLSEPTVTLDVLFEVDAMLSEAGVRVPAESVGLIARELDRDEWRLFVQFRKAVDADEQVEWDDETIVSQIKIHRVGGNPSRGRGGRPRLSSYRDRTADEAIRNVERELRERGSRRAGR